MANLPCTNTNIRTENICTVPIETKEKMLCHSDMSQEHCSVGGPKIQSGSIL